MADQLVTTAQVKARLQSSAGGVTFTAADDTLISELIERSPVFRQLWEEHGAVKRMKGRKTFNHPEIGEIELDWDRLTVPGASGQVLMVYSAAPGTPGATALTLLSTLAATAAQPG